MITRLIERCLKKYLQASKDKFDSDCAAERAQLAFRKVELDDERNNLKIIYDHEINKAKKEAKRILHEAEAEAQAKIVKAAKIGDVLTVEMYKKDIYGRPFFRMAPLLDPEGYEMLKSEAGCMKCKLIYPDGSSQTVKIVPYGG